MGLALSPALALGVLITFERNELAIDDPSRPHRSRRRSLVGLCRHGGVWRRDRGLRTGAEVDQQSIGPGATCPGGSAHGLDVPDLLLQNTRRRNADRAAVGRSGP